MELTGRPRMLTDHRAETTLPASDLERARAFWEGKVGLTVSRETPVGIYYDCAGGGTFRLFKSQGAAAGTHTQVAFIVANLDDEVQDLTARGVVFEEYDSPGFKTEGGIARVGQVRAAWFKDSEGNLVVVAEYPNSWS